MKGHTTHVVLTKQVKVQQVKLCVFQDPGVLFVLVPLRLVLTNPRTLGVVGSPLVGVGVRALLGLVGTSSVAS